MKSLSSCGFGLLAVLASFAIPSDTYADEGAGKRTTLRLDGTWDIAEGSMEVVPKAFDHRVLAQTCPH